MASHSRTLYVGVTKNLEQRVIQHKEKLFLSFTARYNIDQLVFYERFTDIREAVAWETKIKAWNRAKKIALIESKNPHWEDLSNGKITVK